MKLLCWLFMGSALFLLAGCFQITTIVRVNPDGSGTVEESMLLSRKMLAQMEEMMLGFSGEAAAKPKPVDLFDPDKLQKEAAGMGKGVRYLSGKAVSTADFAGYTATYAFTDISELRVGENGGDRAGAPAGLDTPTSVPMTFGFHKGSPATLTIVQHQDPTVEKASATSVPVSADPAAPLSAEDAERVKEMFMGMKFVVAVEVNGTIVETNATHREGQRVTLLDLDFGKLGSAMPQLEKLSRLHDGSIQDAKELLKDMPGMKVDLNEKLTVVFGK